jgi:ComF family protein
MDGSGEGIWRKQGLDRILPLIRRGLDVALPPRCASCGVIVGAAHSFCIDCWRNLKFIVPPCCACCGLPFEFDAGPDALCADCHASRPPFRRARAAFVYDDASRPVILAFKHGDRTDLAPVLTRFLRQAGRDLLAGCEVIVPVPLHRRRLLSRRYNQSALLAGMLARESGLVGLTAALRRIRPTRSQGHLGRQARQRNVAGSIRVDEGYAGQLEGRHVLLVDDVMTTGATVNVCVRALKRSGALSVDVLTLARVVREHR